MAAKKKAVKKASKPAARKSAKKARARKGVIPVSEAPAEAPKVKLEPNPGEKATTEELRKFRDEELRNTPRAH